MSRTAFVILVIAVVVIAFGLMWLGWRARSRRDAGVLTAQQAPTGAVIDQFARVFYVSTTPVGEPLVRVAAPGLKFRGRADIEVREGGVTVEIDSEAPAYFAASQLRGSASAGRRVGKAVEHDGLALMKWDAEGRSLESSFRFDSAAEQRRFAAAINQISIPSSQNESTHQEGAK